MRTIKQINYLVRISGLTLILASLLPLGGCGSSGSGDGSSSSSGGGITQAPTDPNFSHINIWDFGRGIRYVDDTHKEEALDFFATHVDVAESGSDGDPDVAAQAVNNLRERNPDIKVFFYDLDITVCQHVGCVRTNALADDPPGAKESFYLHFSEDTSFTAHFVDPADENVSITGCTGQATRECRMQTGIWYDYRFVYNAKDPEFRAWMANLLLGSAGIFDGLFLDEHGPGLPIDWPAGATGGGIIEYGGRTIDEVDEDYNADLSGALAVYKEAFASEGKFVVINGASWSLSNELVMDQIKAAGGTATEFLHRPTGFDGPTSYRRALDNVDELVAAGALVDLYDAPCRDPEGDFGFTSGLYSSPFARWQMWRLASYYLAREMPDGTTGTGTVYFDPNFCIPFNDPDHVLDFIDKWLPAYEVNVGSPDGSRDADDFASGTSPVAMAASCTQSTVPQYGILSRYYNNGTVLVLVRPNDRWDCSRVVGDESAVTVDLPSPMRLLFDDGTLSAPLSSIQLRNAEAAILFE